MSRLLIENAQVVTPVGESGPLRLPNPMSWEILDGYDVWVEDDRIVDVVKSPSSVDAEFTGDRIQANGRVLLPAWIDCHTHACWAGDRIDEWRAMQSGCSYEERLASGGGIMSTVRAVRSTSRAQLTEQLLERLHRMQRHGTTVAEVKSGYGLSTESELKMLNAIRDAGHAWAGLVIPTACIGHAIDASAHDREQFIRETIHRTLPCISDEFPGIAIDAYCETTAWSHDACRTLFDAAKNAGHSIRVHADQFHSLGMVQTAIDQGYVSVDHLEATSDADLRALAASDVFGVALPCSGFHLDQRYANGRALIDAGGLMAIATNYNPGSAPCYSMWMAAQLACRQLGLSFEESLIAGTANAASVLGLSNRGRIRKGAQADLQLMDALDVRDCFYEFGGNRVAQVICQGRVA